MGKLLPMLTDRTSIELDWECEMKYYWYKMAEGTGIVPATEASFFHEGRNLHEDLAFFPAGAALEEILTTLPPLTEDQIANEILARRIGWLVAVNDHLWPYILSTHEVVQVEMEMIVEKVVVGHRPLWVAVKPDLVLKRKKDGKLIYIEYKTTKTIQNSFALHWPYAIQLHLGMEAVEKELEQPLDHASVIGLYKGGESKGKLRHPYVWAYRNGEKWSKDWVAGWELAPTWEYPGGVVAWARHLGEDVMRAQFAWSVPVYKDPRMLDNMLRRRVIRQEELEGIKPLVLADPTFEPELYFDQSTHCKPIWGPECPYLAACFNSKIHDAPLQSGLYVKRTPHHELEVIGVGEEEDV